MDNEHQNRRVAPYNPNPRWPRGYFEVLGEAGVPKKQHSFYAQWVRQFFNADQTLISMCRAPAQGQHSYRDD